MRLELDFQNVTLGSDLCLSSAQSPHLLVVANGLSRFPGLLRELTLLPPSVLLAQCLIRDVHSESGIRGT